jgi:hypothetical protein
MEIENGLSRRTRRRFSAEEKARVVARYRESGLTRVEFCRREGVSLYNLQRWVGKRGRAGQARFWRLRLEALRSWVVIGFALQGERGWRSKRALMSGKFACWRTLSRKPRDAERGRWRGPESVAGGWSDRSSQRVRRALRIGSQPAGGGSDERATLRVLQRGTDG